VTGIVALFACGAYQVPNADVEATSVFTNNPPCGAMRGFGVFQVNFAAESQMDKLAARLGIDPVELRLMNALRTGDVLPTGQRLTNTLPVVECIRRCQALSPPAPEPLPRDPIRLPGGAGNTTRGEGVRVGEGFAVGYKNMLYPEGYDDHAFARVRLIAGGGGRLVAEVHSAAVEYGQGVTNVITQVVNTELEVDDVVLVSPTTVGMKPAGSTAASRQTAMTGGAVRACCLDLRQQLAKREIPLAEGQYIEAEHVQRSHPTTALDADTGQALGERVVAGFVCAAMRARVEVDVDLGLVRVVWLGVAQDAGKVINPLGAAGQVAGATAQGLGMALMEEIQTQDGIIRNPSFTDYLIPTTLDMPPIDIEFVEEPEADGAYGVKGVGECAIIVAHAAVAAAVRRATGKSLDRLPIRPDDIVF
jgi:CO/xanthine dehydrogenase Mo-binding subunit